MGFVFRSEHFSTTEKRGYNVNHANVFGPQYSYLGSEMKICGSERDMNQWPSRYWGGSGAGSDTPPGSQHPAPHVKP